MSSNLLDEPVTKKRKIEKNNTFKNDEIFLKKFFKDFYRMIIETKDFKYFEKISNEWIKFYLEINDNKNPKNILELMKNHKQSKFWFTSLIGFFYQHGMGCDLDKEKAVELYRLAINNEIEKNSLNENFFKQLHSNEKDRVTFDSLRNENIITGKCLLSLFYYKDIIIDIEGFKYNRNWNESSEQNELTKLVILAKNNDSESQYNLAICYQSGNGVEINYKKAFKWFLNSAKNENPNAQFSLAIFYMDGIGVQKDEEKAFEWFLKSDQNEHLVIQNKNERENFEMQLKLAITNNSIAQNYLGDYYQNGKEIGKNEKKAFEWYLKAAEGGDKMAQNSLGHCYQYGKGIDKDETKAFVWYLKSAVAGCAKGQCSLGDCYAKAIGTNKNNSKAYKWYLKSALAGYAQGQHNLGDCYQYGKGIKKDEKRAFKWYLISAYAGYALGQRNLGYCYAHAIGTIKNETKAFEWYLKAAQNKKES
ncbi:hypothetical protein C1645_820087 [Glomus cerebriforme]|uniref:HCP-like protein n=1 Tax=Glomus cerebriforme TaxID=658196 RepID=A0A397TDB0_9GLOM|nr:hypothetical protein C1645_820087 [Glomus cerebriforme]